MREKAVTVVWPAAVLNHSHGPRRGQTDRIHSLATPQSFLRHGDGFAIHRVFPPSSPLVHSFEEKKNKPENNKSVLLKTTTSFLACCDGCDRVALVYTTVTSQMEIIFRDASHIKGLFSEKVTVSGWQAIRRRASGGCWGIW